jgi:hypothetical protein
MSVEKSSVGPERAEVPRKLDRCSVRHEIEALILTGIRVRGVKRRNSHRFLPTTIESMT